MEYSVTWWNVENLLDIANSPDREKRIKKFVEKDVKQWTQTKLNRKLAQLAKIIGKLNNEKGPDILGVCEIENKKVLELLIDELEFLNRNYDIAHHDTSDGRGIDVAFIFDKDMFRKGKTFQRWIVKRSATRELYQVNMTSTLSGNEFVLIGNHWPSRIPSKYNTEPYRMLAAETLSYWLERIMEEKSANTPILVMGDFNDEPFDRSIKEYALGTNLRSKVTRGKNPWLYNMMWPLLAEGLATHYYKRSNEYTILDQFMVTKGFLKSNSPLKIKKSSARVEMIDEMRKGRKPIRMGLPARKNYNANGFSDHFPISVIIEEN